MEKMIIRSCVGGIYTGVSQKYQRGVLKGMSRCLKANANDASCLCRVKVKPCAVRGRKMLRAVRTDYGKKIRKDYEAHRIDARRNNIQCLEPRDDHICNCITGVTKDYMYLARVHNGGAKKNMVSRLHTTRKQRKLIDLWNRQNIRQMYSQKSEIDKYLFNGFGIFKLTPRECGRLQGVSDSDIDAIMSTVSNSQAYKQFGNSITVSVLCAVFSQLGIKDVKKWNDMSFDEQNELSRRDIRMFEDSETELAKKTRLRADWS